MFAIIQTGGKQYKVSQNDIIEVEKLDANVGEKISFEVLMLKDEETVIAGTPVVEGAVCEAEVVSHGKSDKIVVFKYKPKKNQRTKQGHRQPFSQIKILSIKK